MRIDELSEALARHASEPLNAIYSGAASARIDSSKSLNDVNYPTSLQADAVLLDPSCLGRLKEFDDEQLSMTHEIVVLFIQDAPLRVMSIQAAFAPFDTADLARAAQALTGTAANVGAAALANACSSLEQACSDGLLHDDAAVSVAGIVQLIQLSVAELSQWQHRHQQAHHQANDQLPPAGAAP